METVEVEIAVHLATDVMTNSFGHNLVLTTFGESHGPAMGGVLDGFPSGFAIDFGRVERDLAERRPQCTAETQRREPDHVSWLSGIMDGKTLGTPIAFVIPNEDVKSGDYEDLRHVYRPSHADITYDMKYGIRDWRGGGRASGRETVSRVLAGSLAMQWLETKGVTVSVETVVSDREVPLGDSIGGTVNCRITGVRAGIGSPVFAKLQSRLADAMLSIPACRSFEYGAGAKAASMLGSEHNDQMEYREGKLRFITNNSGGILGGIATGEDICFSVAFKPAASISKVQKTVDDAGNNTEVKIEGRHDQCIARRASAVVRAMAALVIMDSYLI